MLRNLSSRVAGTTNYSHVFDFKRARDPVILPPNRDCRGKPFTALYDRKAWQQFPGWHPGLTSD